MQELLDQGTTVASGDVFLTGELRPAGDDAGLRKVDGNFAGYTFGYNRPLLAHRVRDVLSLVEGVSSQASPNGKPMELRGIGAAGFG
ncbi:MAG: hypothetical protein R3B90_00995 [Planctomycetaceae bacterium]